MPLKKYKPITPIRRFRQSAGFEELTKGKKAEKRLTEASSHSGGRNNQGRITTRHRGGGEKRRYRIVDFKRDKDGIPAKVTAIEYDPNRSARLALLTYKDGEKRYILAPLDLKVGDFGALRPRRGSPQRELHAAREHPDRYADPRHRAPARPRGADRALRRRRRAARGQGG